MILARSNINLIIAVSVFFAISCSSGQNSNVGSGTTLGGRSTNGGSVALSVSDSYKPASVSDPSTLPEVLQVTSFHVAISGDNFSTIEATFSGDAAGGQIEGIPVGENRRVLVEALNANGVVVRRREISNVRITGGDVTPIVASLLSVPVVTNVSNDNMVTQTRLFFRGYAEPAGSLQVWDSYQGGESRLIEEASVRSDVISPSLSDGGFNFRPSALPLGAHLFTLKDPSSGEETKLQLTVVKPGREPGVGNHSAGNLHTETTQTLGSLGEFPKVLEMVQTHP